MGEFIMVKIQVNSQGKAYLTSGGKVLLAGDGGENYPGLATQYYKTDSLIPYLDISSGAFKDYTVNYESAKGSLGTVGNDYITGKNQNGRFYNGIINHGCTITDEGLVTGFSTAGDGTTYFAVNLKNTFPSSISQFKVIIKAKLDSSSTTGHAVLFATSTAPERYIALRNSTNFALYNSGWTQGSTTVAKDVWYWYCVTFDGSTTTGYILEDNNYTLNTLPQLSQWSQEWTSASNIWANNSFIFGSNPFSGSESFSGGIIDLGNTSIEVNNEPFYNWEMTSPTAITATGILKSGLSDSGSATSYNLYYDGSYELDTGTQESHFGGVVEVPAHTVETPIVANFKVADFLSYDTAKKGFSMFSADNYIEAKYKFNVTSAQWASGVKIQIHFKTAQYYDGYTDYKPLFFANFRDNPIYDYNYGMQLQLESGATPWFVLSDANGNRYFSLSGSSLQYDTEYWLRIVNPTSGAPYMELSTDGTTWSTVATYSSSVSISDITSTENLKLAVGRASTVGNVGVFNGTIYAEDTFIEINNQRVWSMI